jgi:hypothetical protein
MAARIWSRCRVMARGLYADGGHRSATRQRRRRARRMRGRSVIAL